MITKADEKYLQNHKLFHGLNFSALKQIFKTARKKSFKAGQSVLQEGGKANHFYIIIKGRIHILSAKQDMVQNPQYEKVVIQTLEKDEILGWAWLIPPHNWHFDSRAAEDTQAYELDGKYLRAQCEKNHDLGFELFKRITHLVVQRLRATRMYLQLYGGQAFGEAEGA